MVRVRLFEMNRLTVLKTFALFLCLAMLSIVVLSPVNAATIQVTSDRDPVGLNESFQLVYESSDSPDDDPDFAPLEQYLDILNRSQSSNVSIINGRYNSSKKWSLTVMARQVGDIVLPPVEFGSDLSDAIKITVKAAADNQAAQSSFYSRIRVDQEQVYAQQQVVITQQLFSDRNMSAYGMGELDFNGMDVISQPLGDEKQYKTRIGNTPYLVIERSYAIFPQTSGLLKLSPVLVEARIGSTSNSFFNSLGGNPVVRARSNAVEIAVLPVPDNINVNPWLPAKSFQLLEQWPQNPPKFKQGEPVTRTLSIKAEGLTAAQLPVLPDILTDGLKQYPDQPLLNDIKNDNGITGYRVEKVALIPTNAGRMILPAIDIPWWNTVTQKREVARIPERTIEVQAAAINTAKAAAVQAPPGSVEPEIKQSNSPIPANEQSGEPLQAAQTIWSQYWFLLVIFLALGWLITALAWVVSVNKKSQPVKHETNKSTTAKQAFKQLKIACEKKDVTDCRGQLLSWARALFSTQDIRSLRDLIPFSGEQMRLEISKIDAVLYGNQDQSINFTVIIDQAKQMMQQYENNSSDIKPELLEPLYK